MNNEPQIIKEIRNKIRSSWHEGKPYLTSQINAELLQEDVAEIRRPVPIHQPYLLIKKELVEMPYQEWPWLQTSHMTMSRLVYE